MVKGKYFNKSLFDIWRLKSNTYHQAFKDIFFKRFIKTFSLLSQFFFFPTSQRVEDRNEETEKESAAQFSGIIKVQSTFFLAPLLTYEKHSHSSVTQFFFFFFNREDLYTAPQTLFWISLKIWCSCEVKCLTVRPSDTMNDFLIALEVQRCDVLHTVLTRNGKGIHKLIETLGWPLLEFIIIFFSYLTNRQGSLK